LNNDNESSYSSGRVLRSIDGGANWTNISASSTLGSRPSEMALSPDGTLWVTEKFSNQVWRYQNGAWLQRWARTPNPVADVAVDPTDPNRIFAASENGGISRSLDGGASWERIAAQADFANTFGWLPQQIQPNFRATASIAFDAGGELLMVQGNEGVLSWTPSPGNPANLSNPPQWTIISEGIEELVTHDVKLLPGSGDRAITAVHDATGHVIDDPDTFTAQWIDQQDQLIVNGTGVNYAPDNPDFVVIASGDPNNIGSGDNYSSYSLDGGDTWNYFASRPPEFDGGYPAISLQNGRSWDQTPVVILPLGNYPPIWSDNGGQTWQPAAGFDLITQAEADAVPEGTPGDPVPNWQVGRLDAGQIGFQELSLRQHALAADPFIADRFYLKLTNGGFWRSDDGGRNWTQTADDSKLPMGTFHGQLRANPRVANELWFSAGNEGAFAQNGDPNQANGLWRSQDAGVTWQKIPGIAYSFALDLGVGSSQPGDADHAIYFYGQLDNDPDWGTFRSDDRGTTWDRISNYPTGLIDVVTSVGASWDTYGLVYLGFVGNSFVYGQPSGGQAGGQQPFGGTALSISDGAILEAENYDTGGQGVAYNDADPGNNGNAYRTDGVDIGIKSAASNGHAVGWTNNGEWLEYTLDVTDPGVYDLTLGYSSGASNPGSVQLDLNGNTAGTFTGLQNTGGSSTFSSVTLTDITLNPGPAILRLTNVGNGFDLDHIQFDKQQTPGGSNVVALEAEAGQLGSLWDIKTDSTASGGSYLEVQPGNNSTGSAPTSSNARATFSFSLADAGTYRIYGRTIAPNTGDDSFWVRVDGGAWVRWNGIAGSSAWQWDAVHDSDNNNQPVDWSLAAGAHTLEIAYREDGTRLDKLVIQPASLPTPSGTGPGTSSLTPKLKIEAEEATGSPLWATANDGPITYRQVIDGTSGSSNYSDPNAAPRLTFEYVAPTGGGLFDLNLRGRGNDFGSNSLYVRINSGTWQQVNFGGSNVWETVTVGSFNLTEGVGIVEIAQREDGTDLDFVELVSV
ncbi:MAG: carbohydrate-binding protein, partial [Planctomycetota bacterium]